MKQFLQYSFDIKKPFLYGLLAFLPYSISHLTLERVDLISIAIFSIVTAYFISVFFFLLKKNLYIDFLFVVSLFFFAHVALFICLLDPTRLQEVLFYRMLPQVSASTFYKALLIETQVLTIWLGVRSIFSFSVPSLIANFEYKKRNNVWLVYFIISNLAQLYFSITFQFNIAGLKSNLPLQGYVYYLLPSDILAIMFAPVLVYKQVWKKAGWLMATAVLTYIALKVYQGWKSGLYTIGIIAFCYYLFSRQFKIKIADLFKIGVLLVLAGYISSLALLFRFYQNVTKGEGDFSVSQIEALNQESAHRFSLYDRLIEGNNYGLYVMSLDDSDNYFPEKIGPLNFYADIIESLVPGDFLGLENVSMYFSRYYLFQNLEDETQYALGILGYSYFLNPWLGAIIYVGTYAFFFSFVIKLANVTKQFSIKFISLGILTLMITFVTEGGVLIIVQLINAVVIFSLLAWFTRKIISVFKNTLSPGQQVDIN